MTVDLIVLGFVYNYSIDNIESGISNSGANYSVVILILIFVALFELSIGPIAWMYMSEVMTEKGTSVGTLINLLFTIMFALFTANML